MAEEEFPEGLNGEPETFPYAVLDENNVVTNCILSSHEYAANYPNWIYGPTAKIGDVWTGTEFITPPPPEPTVAQYNTMLNDKLAALERSRRNVLRNAILNSTNPPINTEQGFIDAMENWDWENWNA